MPLSADMNDVETASRLQPDIASISQPAQLLINEDELLQTAIKEAQGQAQSTQQDSRLPVYVNPPTQVDSQPADELNFAEQQNIEHSTKPATTEGQKQVQETPNELVQKKVDGLSWLQSLLREDNIQIGSDDTPDTYAKLDMHECLKTGFLLCKALNNLMSANPNFVEANLPLIQINDRTDMFASMSNLSSFVRTCELYFNIDRHGLFDPISVLSSTKDERQFIETLHFLRQFVQENGLSAPVFVSKPFVSVTFDQLSQLVHMVTASPAAPVVAYDPRVVLSIQDMEVFQKLVSKIDAIESNQKTLAVLTQQLCSHISKMESDHHVMSTKLEGLSDGILQAFESVSHRLHDLHQVTDIIGNSASNIHSAMQMFNGRSIQADSVLLNTLDYQRDTLTQISQSDGPQSYANLVTNNISSSAQSTSPSPSIAVQMENYAEGSYTQSSTLMSSPAASPVRAGTPAVFNYPPAFGQATASSLQEIPRSSSFGAQNFKAFKLPAEVLSLNLPKDELMRQSVLYEVIDSEADYVRDINVMLEYHYKELKTMGLLDDAQLKTMFSNLTDLLPVNQALLSSVVMRRDESPVISGIGDILLRVSPSLMVYDDYCANYPNALSLYKSLKSREDIKQYLERSMSSPECRGLSLESFLIKPVQRICKYPLLLRELIKYTPNDNPDKALLQQAIIQIEAVVTLVNEKTRASGDRDKLQELQNRIDANPPLQLTSVSGRRIIKEAPIQRIVAVKPKDRHLIILNDMVIICKSHIVGKVSRLLFEQSFELNKCLVNPNPNPKLAGGNSSSAQKLLKTMFEIVCGPESFAFNCQSDQEKVRYVQLFEETIRDAPKNGSQVASAAQPVSRSVSSGSTAATSKTVNYASNSKTLRKKTGSFFGGGSKGKGSQESLAIPEDIRESSPLAAQPSSVSVVKKSSSSLSNDAGVTPLPSQSNQPEILMQQSPIQQAQQQQEQQQQQVIPLMIEGYPQWRAVDSGLGAFYYFNVDTNETSWYHPQQLALAAQQQAFEISPPQGPPPAQT